MVPLQINQSVLIDHFGLSAGDNPHQWKVASVVWFDWTHAVLEHRGLRSPFNRSLVLRIHIKACGSNDEIAALQRSMSAFADECKGEICRSAAALADARFAYKTKIDERCRSLTTRPFNEAETAS